MIAVLLKSDNVDLNYASMKNVLLILVICAFYTSSIAQSIKILPVDKDSVSGHPSSIFLKSLLFQVKNISGDTATIWWVKEKASMPSEWCSVVRDTTLCWNDETDSASFLMNSNAVAPILLFFYPMVTEGCGLFEIFVYKQGDRTNDKHI